MSMRPHDDLALKIDTASDARDEKSLLRLGAECEGRLRTAQGIDRVYLLYYWSNVFNSVVAIGTQAPQYDWSWDQPEEIRNILLLRRALAEPSFPRIDPVLTCQIHTNLANRLNGTGRPIAANESHLRTLNRIPKFAKALVGRAYLFEHYARQLYDDGHIPILLSTARTLLDEALDDTAFWESDDRDAFATTLSAERDRIISELQQNRYDEKDLNLEEWALGDSEEEVRYRRWCLKERLFVNPLNDVFTKSVAATDVLHLPNHVYGIDESPRFPRYFNVMKQEYASARYNLYRGMFERSAHFAMRDVVFLDSGEGQVLGHYTEELTASFRSSYAIFDKVGLFLNDYFRLGMNPSKVTFRNVWLENPHRPDSEVRSEFQELRNWSLRGLYFLSKDLFDSDFKEVAEPDAFEIAQLRNQLEHRFLSFQAFEEGKSTETHRFISIDEFEVKALRLLKMAREALIYLSLAMRLEEQRREENNIGSKSIRGVVAAQRIDGSNED